MSGATIEKSIALGVTTARTSGYVPGPIRMESLTEALGLDTVMYVGVGAS